MARKPKAARPERPLDDILSNQGAQIHFHAIYLSLFSAYKGCPEQFGIHNMTRILTGLMGDRLWSWRVVGITPEALALFAEHEFNKPPKRGSVVRGHLHSRRLTTKALFDLDAPLPLDQFFAVFLENDKTVLMLQEQNPSRGDHVPDYIEIDNPHAHYFPCGRLVGYLHEEQEIEFLKKLVLTHTEQEHSGDRHD